MRLEGELKREWVAANRRAATAAKTSADVNRKRKMDNDTESQSSGKKARGEKMPTAREIAAVLLDMTSPATESPKKIATPKSTPKKGSFVDSRRGSEPRPKQEPYSEDFHSSASSFTQSSARKFATPKPRVKKEPVVDARANSEPRFKREPYSGGFQSSPSPSFKSTVPKPRIKKEFGMSSNSRVKSEPSIKNDPEFGYGNFQRSPSPLQGVSVTGRYNAASHTLQDGDIPLSACIDGEKACLATTYDGNPGFSIIIQIDDGQAMVGGDVTCAWRATFGRRLRFGRGCTGRVQAGISGKFECCVYIKL